MAGTPTVGFIFIFFVFLPFLPWHMEVPRLGVQSELELPAYTTATATAMPDPNRICNLCHSSPQYQILNPQTDARDLIHILMGTGWVCNPLSHNKNSLFVFLTQL